MAKSPTIEEVKKRKIELESSIMDLLSEFESDNGVAINYISLNREHKDFMEAPVEQRMGKLKNVDASMELDLIM